MDRFTAMATFVRVVERGSLSAAARELGVTQPAVSQQVAGLERLLGTRLLHRTTRRLALTEAGTAYYAVAKRVLDELAVTEESLAGLSRELVGALRVHAPVAFGQRYLGPLAVAFGKAHPRLTVELILDDRIADLTEQNVDVAIRFGGRATAGLIARPLGAVTRVLVAAPEYVAAHGYPATPAALAGHPLVRFSWASSGDEVPLRGPDGVVSVRMRPRFLANDNFVLIEALRAGLGVGAAQVPLVHELIAQGALVRVLPRYECAPLAVHAAFPSRQFVPRKARAFVAHVAEALPGIPGVVGRRRAGAARG